MPRPINPLRRINNLYNASLDMVERELHHLKNLTIGDKLPPGAAKDLREYFKLLSDLREAMEGIQAAKKAKAEKAVKGLDEAGLLEKINK